MRILFIDSDDDTYLVLSIIGMNYDPKFNRVQVWTPDSECWECNDVSPYQYSIWSAKLLDDGYLRILDTRYKWENS